MGTFVGSVLVVADAAQDAAARLFTCGLLTLARRLGTADVLVCGEDRADSAESKPGESNLFGRYGAARIFLAAGAAGATEADAIVELTRRTQPIAVLIAASRQGHEIAARVALRLNSGVITDAVEVYAGPDGPMAVQEVFAGAYLTGSVFRRGTPVITVRHDAARAIPLAVPTDPIIERVTITHSAVHSSAVRRARLLSRTPKTGGARPELTTAPVVVAGGRGLGSADGFELLGRVADAFGGAVGGSQAAADLGWCPRQARIDQTGAAVRPRLYLACGISGSVRHRAGMQHARTIVAIDKDPAAPIFGIADFGVVGDVRKVLPALLAEIARRRGNLQHPPGADDLDHTNAEA